MKQCPNCKQSVADHISFCPQCGNAIPAPEPKVAAAEPAPKAKGNKGLVTALWITLVANVLICALLISCTLGLFGPMAQYQKLTERLDELEEWKTNHREDQLSDNPTTPSNPTNPDPTDPTDSSPADPTDSSTTDPAPTAPPVTQPTEPPKEAVTIKVWTPAEDQNERHNWLEEMQSRFAAQYPQYEITWDNEVMDEGSAAGYLTWDTASGADVYMFVNDQLYGLVNAGCLTQLDGTFETQVRNDNSQFHINTVTHTDGSIYGFPVANNTWFMYYNKDVFTPEDVKSLDTMLSKGKVCVPFNIGWNSGCFFLGTGCTVFGQIGNDAAKGIDFGGQKGYTAAKKMIEVASNGNCISGGMDEGKLIDGEVGAIFSGSWSASGLKSALGDKLGVAPLPTFEADGQTYRMTALSGSKCVGVNPNAGFQKGKMDLCKAFAAFLASEEGQLLRYELRGVIPSHQNLRYHEAILNDPVAMAEMETITNASVVQSALPEMGQYWSPVETFGHGCTNGDINLSNYMDMVDMLNEQLNHRGI